MPNNLKETFPFPPNPLPFEDAQRRRLCFRNERTLYPRTCDGTGEKIISIYSPDKPYKIYKSDYWYSDKWDPLSYSRDFDMNRPFFEQLKELQSKAAKSNGLSRVNLLNSMSAMTGTKKLTVKPEPSIKTIAGSDVELPEPSLDNLEI